VITIFKNNPSKISDAEWQVMDVIWNEGRTTSQNIVKHLEPNTKWSERTIKTLIGRLVKKEIVGYDVDPGDKRLYYYYPLADREKCIKEETSMFLKKFYNGAISSMISNFVKEEELTDAELDELVKILKSAKSKED
jgi:BlaI family penicillinase repressor